MLLAAFNCQQTAHTTCFLPSHCSLQVLYALGANKAAVRCIEATTDRMLCSGDDGNSVLYHFN